MNWNYVFLGALLFGISVLWWLNALTNIRRNGERSDEIGGYQLKPELGMEATDVDAVNAALSRNAAWGEVPQELQGLGRTMSSYVAPVKDDETYAKRYQAAFGSTEKKK